MSCGKWRKKVSNNIVGSNYDRKQKMYGGEKKRLAVVPVILAKNDFSSILSDEKLSGPYKKSFNIFCAGDFIKNAFVYELKSFASYNWFYEKNCNLFIVMQNYDSDEEKKIKYLAELLGIEKKVVFVQDSLGVLAKSLFEISSVFISLNNYSENSIYCYEAMKTGKVVISCADGKLPELLNGSGIVVTDKRNQAIGSLINEISKNQELFNHICENEKKEIELYDEKSLKNQEIIGLENINDNERTVVFDNSEKTIEYPDVRIFENRIPSAYEFKGAINLLKFDNSCELFSPSEIDYINDFIDGVGAESELQVNNLIENGIIVPVKKISNNDWNDFIEEVFSTKRKYNVSMVTTWNSRCGIAEYTKMEVKASLKNIQYEIYPNRGVELLQKDEEFVQARTWIQNYNEDFMNLAENLLRSKNEIVHIQFHYGLFQNLSLFAAFLDKITGQKKVVITFHKTADNDFITRVESLKTIVNSLNRCAALVVHAESDENRLKEYGVTAPIHIIEHGQLLYPDIKADEQKKKLGIKASVVVGSYGFLIPHKGILEAIQSIAILKKTIPDILYMPVCSLSGGNDSELYFKQCSAEIEKLGLQDNVKMITDFLPNDESMKYLKACNVMVMPYKPTQESASGAVRFCIAAARPMVTTKQKIFDEFKDCAHRIEETTPELIAEGIRQALNPSVGNELVKNEKAYMMKTSWYATADKFYELYKGM